MVARRNNQTPGVTDADIARIDAQRDATRAARAAFAAFWAQRRLYRTSSPAECRRATAFLPSTVNGSSHDFWNARGAR